MGRGNMPWGEYSTQKSIHSAHQLWSHLSRGCQSWLVGVLAVCGALAQAAQSSAGVHELVILRANDGAQVQLNVSYKGQLQAALGAGEYTVMPVCPGDAAFDAVIWAPGTQSGRSQNIQAGPGFDARRQVMWVEVSPTGRVWTTPQPRDSVNWNEWTLHSRVVSRVRPQCADTTTPVAIAPVAVPTTVTTPILAKSTPVIRSMELASDLLFPFAASKIDHRQADKMLSERLRAVLPEGDVSGITGIRVIGHSDPVGQPHRKALVSRQRAQEVADYLQSILGIPPALFSVETQSDLELLVANCPQQPVVQRNACNAPNRRVEVLISIQP